MWPEVTYATPAVGSTAPPGPARKAAARATAALVVLVLVLAGVSYTFDLGNRWLGWDYLAGHRAGRGAPPPG